MHAFTSFTCTFPITTHRRSPPTLNWCAFRSWTQPAFTQLSPPVMPFHAWKKMHHFFKAKIVVMTNVCDINLYFLSGVGTRCRHAVYEHITPLHTGDYIKLFQPHILWNSVRIAFQPTLHNFRDISCPRFRWQGMHILRSSLHKCCELSIEMSHARVLSACLPTCNMAAWQPLLRKSRKYSSSIYSAWY